MEYQNRNARLEKLMEREKELNCLYSVENLLVDDKRKLEHILMDLVKEIPLGWQYPNNCKCRIKLEDKEYSTDDFRETEYMQFSDIIVDEHVAGRIEVSYLQLSKMHQGNAFLSEEQKLLNTTAISIGKNIFRRQLKSTLEYIKSRGKGETVYDDDMILNPDSDEHWKWRFDMAEKIADHLDLERFGLKSLYLIGSTKNACAGPGSDIDLMAHSEGEPDQIEKFKLWIEGWGYCLGEMNYLKTGYQSNESLIDLHIITDEDISKQDSYARMIGAISDRARPLKVINES